MNDSVIWHDKIHGALFSAIASLIHSSSSQDKILSKNLWIFILFEKYLKESVNEVLQVKLTVIDIVNISGGYSLSMHDPLIWLTPDATFNLTRHKGSNYVSALVWLYLLRR